MLAYLYIVLAVITRVVPHAWSFTAVGGGLLYFGARRPLRQMWLPLLALAATDYYLTHFAYGYPFVVKSYLLTWSWHVAVMLIGFALLRKTTTAGRVAAAAIAASAGFFLVSNFAVWLSFGSYPHTAAGLGACYVAGLPYYGRDLLSTLMSAAVMFGVPALARQISHSRSAHRATAA